MQIRLMSRDIHVHAVKSCLALCMLFILGCNHLTPARVECEEVSTQTKLLGSQELKYKMSGYWQLVSAPCLSPNEFEPSRVIQLNSHLLAIDHRGRSLYLINSNDRGRHLYIILILLKVKSCCQTNC